MRTTRAFVLTALCVLIVAVAGCHKVVGGGWIDGLYGGKAHFGFQAQCEEFMDDDGWYNAGFFTGQVQFQDKSAGVRWHGEFEIANIVFSPDPLTCEEVGAAVVSELGNYAEMHGECRTQPGNVAGEFSVIVEDLEGEVGWDRSDTIHVITDCTPDGSVYEHSGQLRGGNISFPGHKNKGGEE